MMPLSLSSAIIPLVCFQVLSMKMALSNGGSPLEIFCFFDFSPSVSPAFLLYGEDSSRTWQDAVSLEHGSSDVGLLPLSDELRIPFKGLFPFRFLHRDSFCPTSDDSLQEFWSLSLLLSLSLGLDLEFLANSSRVKEFFPGKTRTT